MSTTTRKFITWFYIIVTALTFLAVAAITAFEVFVRWTINQNFSVLDANALTGLAILLAAQMLGLVWLQSR